MSDERYYPGYLNEAEYSREQMRQREMVERITRARSPTPSQDDFVRKAFSRDVSDCPVLARVKDFLMREMAEIEREHFLTRFHEIYVKRVVTRDNLFYVFVDITDHNFEEGSWVEIKTGEFCQFGSLWRSERHGFYLITEYSISPGYAMVREADAYKLALMQIQALDLLVQGSTDNAVKLKRIICGSLVGPEKAVSVAFHNDRLNDFQKEAVKKALGVCEDNPFFLVHGPPGTGKTTVITEVVRHLTAQGKRVLITSHTNVAVDNVVENLFESLKTRMVRLGPKTKVSKMLKEVVPTTSDELVELKTAPIVGATLSKASILVMTGKLSWSEPFFDVVIVDESSMATIPLTLAGILLGKTFVLVGDHFQLPPITKARLPQDCESLFQLLMQKYPEKSSFLGTQYRSHPSIVEFSSRNFYEKKAGKRIESHESCKDHKISINKRTLERVSGTINENPLLCLDTSDVANESPVGWFSRNSLHNRSYSYFNEYEAAVALSVRHDLLVAGLSPDQMCIITPYRLQRQIIKEAVRGIYGSIQDDVVSLEDLTSATVDSIQGKERDVIIYCTTWVPRTDEEKSRIHIALKDWRRLNVALTRARKKLIIVGAISELWAYPYDPLYRFLEERNAVIRVPRIDDNNDILEVLRHYWDKKTREDRIEQSSLVRDAIQRLRAEVKANGILTVAPEPEPVVAEHQSLVPEVQTIEPRKDRVKPYVPLLSATDFEEYGKVKKFLKENPKADDKEIAAKTRLHVSRVTELRMLIQSKENAGSR